MLLDQMRILGPITEETTRQMLKVDTKVEFLKLLHSLASDFPMMLTQLDSIESRLMPLEIWKGLLEAMLDCYLVYRSVPTELDQVEQEWAKHVIAVGATFLTSSMQLTQQLPTPHSMVDVRFNLYQLAERTGRKNPVAQATSVRNIQDLARRSAVARSNG
jgi:DNA polymerase III gamma/tau subunit